MSVRCSLTSLRGGTACFASRSTATTGRVQTVRGYSTLLRATGNANAKTSQGRRNVGTTSNVSEWPFPFLTPNVPREEPPRFRTGERNTIYEHRLKTSGTSASASARTTNVTATKPVLRKTTFNSNYSLFAKRPARPFPPPFTTPNSFSDPFNRSPTLRGLTNGDDAILITPKYMSVADGVGAWNTRVNGHASLWSRLMLHFWSLEMDKSPSDPVECLEKAYSKVLSATREHQEGDDEGVRKELQGTTTFSGAIMIPPSEQTNNGQSVGKVGFLNLGDSQGFLIRPSSGKVVFKTAEQWHWFDCPAQLGTNSPDTPKKNATYTVKEVQKGDIILLATDGLMDNLWEDEILEIVLEGEGKGGEWTANELLNRAMARARDPFAESPYMERAVDNGLSLEGGKWDDISVVLGRVEFESTSK